jgi:3',5'-nucleoside bisphosphate phosphatase
MRSLTLVGLLSLITLDAQPAFQQRRVLPVPKVNGFETLKCDFHMHTVFSDGVVWPETRVYEAYRDGLDALAITDHDDYHPHKETVSVDLSHGFRLAKDQAEQYGLLLIPALEVTKGDIHVNALFATDVNVTAGKPLLDALRLMKEQGAFLFWNHPGWKGDLTWQAPVDEAHRNGLIHGVEVVNSDLLEPQTLPWLEPKKLTMLANTDVHELVEIPAGQHRSPITLVFSRTRDAAGIREALLARRTLAWRQDEMWGAGDLLTGFFEASIQPVSSALLLRDGSVKPRFQNVSAVPFQAKLVSAPPWLKVPAAVTFAAERETLFTAVVDRTKPAGPQRGEVEWEITNLHIPMGGSPRVKMVLQID